MVSWVGFCVTLMAVATLAKPIHSCSWCAVKILLWNVSLSEHWFPVQHPVLSRSSTELCALGACCAAACNILWCPNQEVATHLWCLLDNAQFLCSLEMMYLPDEWHSYVQTKARFYLALPWIHLVPLKPLWKCPWSSMLFYWHSISWEVFLMFLKGLGFNDFSAMIIPVCRCQHCLHTVALLLSCWNFTLCGRSNDTDSCNCSVPNSTRQSDWDDARLQNIILRFINLQCNPSLHPTATLTLLPWPVHSKFYKYCYQEWLLLLYIPHSKPSCYFHFSHLRNNHSGTVVHEDQELWIADVVKWHLNVECLWFNYTLLIWFIYRNHNKRSDTGRKLMHRGMMGRRFALLKYCLSSSLVEAQTNIRI